MSSSAVAVLRSACSALRRTPFPRGLLIERQPPPWSWPRSQNLSARRFHSSDCTVGKKPETNKATVEDDGVSRKLDQINRGFDRFHAALKEYGELVLEKRDRRRKLLARRRTIFAGVLAAIYAKHRFSTGSTTEDKEMSTGNI